MGPQERAELLATVLPWIVDGGPMEGPIGHAEHDGSLWQWRSVVRRGEVRFKFMATRTNIHAIGGADVVEKTEVVFEVDGLRFAGKPMNAATIRAAIKLAVSRLYDGPRAAPVPCELPQPKVALCDHQGCSEVRTRGRLCDSHAARAEAVSRFDVKVTSSRKDLKEGILRTQVTLPLSFPAREEQEPRPKVRLDFVTFGRRPREVTDGGSGSSVATGLPSITWSEADEERMVTSEWPGDFVTEAMAVAPVTAKPSEHVGRVCAMVEENGGAYRQAWVTMKDGSDRLAHLPRATSLANSWLGRDVVVDVFAGRILRIAGASDSGDAP